MENALLAMMVMEMLKEKEMPSMVYVLFGTELSQSLSMMLTVNAIQTTRNVLCAIDYTTSMKKENAHQILKVAYYSRTIHVWYAWKDISSIHKESATFYHKTVSKPILKVYVLNVLLGIS